MTTGMNEKRTAHWHIRMDCPGVDSVIEALDDRIGGRAVSWPKPRQSAEDDAEPTIERGRE